MRKTLLILSANPNATDRLRLDQEVRQIDEGLQRSQHRDDFEIHQKWAVRPSDVHRALLSIRPEIIHFAGHGAGKDGILLEDNSGNPCLVSGDALSSLFKSFPQIECVFLNACYTEFQAEAIAQHVGYVVGMNSAVDDDHATAFAVAFYETISAARSYDDAYNIGCSVMLMHGAPRDMLPILIKSPESVEQRTKYEVTLQEQFLLDRLRQEREFDNAVGNIAHDYAKEVVMEILARLAQVQITSAKSEHPDLSGRWQGMVNGREQTVDIRQKGTVVYLAGVTHGTPEYSEHYWTGEGRVFFNTLVFSWSVDKVKGFDVLSVLGNGDVLDGKYFTAWGERMRRRGIDIYHRMSDQE